uniref:serine/threonine-protein kinase LMTK2-like n=1 Tax=Semicossyphus pulcher TaxID=241346 RepID=UPI0037E90B5B
MYDRFIIFFDKDLPQDLFGDVYYTEDCRASIEDTGWHISDKSLLSDLKNFTANWPHNLNTNTNNSVRIQHEPLIKDNLSTSNLKSPRKSCQISGASGVSSERDKTVRRRKSVSFDEDVMVYLFDQESPTLELHTGPCTSLPSSSSYNLPDVTLEDIGLEWEDDFSALEKNCHFQHVGHSQHFTFSLPTQSCTAPSRPERFSLSQSCLFLTHVAESDLEL